MCAFALFLSVDPSLGRVDYKLLSDQTLMEMLIEGFDDETKKRYQDYEGMYRDVCKWSCIKCDDSGRVIEIIMDDEDLGGSLELCYVPPKVKVLNINWWLGSRLTGPVDLTHLPEGMESLCLKNNRLSGSLVIKNVPQWLDIIDLRGNQFNAIAVVDAKTNATIQLKDSGVTSVVDENGKELDMQRFL